MVMGLQMAFSLLWPLLECTERSLGICLAVPLSSQFRVRGHRENSGITLLSHPHNHLYSLDKPHLDHMETVEMG